jgi:hypothetical protein
VTFEAIRIRAETFEAVHIRAATFEAVHIRAATFEALHIRAATFEGATLRSITTVFFHSSDQNDLIESLQKHFETWRKFHFPKVCQGNV